MGGLREAVRPRGGPAIESEGEEGGGGTALSSALQLVVPELQCAPQPVSASERAHRCAATACLCECVRESSALSVYDRWR